MFKMTPVEIDATQKRMWIDTRSALLWTCPAFTHILFTMLNPEKGELAAFFTKDIDVAATDGENLIINPEEFFKYTLSERVLIVAHEILHCVFNHVNLCRPFTLSGKVKYLDGTVLPYEHRLMNMAMDYVINDVLVQSKVGTMPKDGCWDQNIATKDDNFLDTYKKVYKDQGGKGKGGQGQKPGGGNGAGQPGGGGQQGHGKGQGFDTLVPAGAVSGKDPGQAAQGRSQAAWDAAVAGAIATAKLQGKLPGALERLLSEVLEPKVSWQDHIRALFNRKVGNSGYDWRKPDRRMIQRDIFSPARSGHGCGEIVVGVDTSGSIGQKELDVFFAEMRGILEDLKPTKLYLVWCDAKVHKVEELDNSADLDGLKPYGGGGTDFRPVFDWVYNEGINPDALVYFTDMLGEFPKTEPRYPVIWADIHGRVKAPFGDLVHIDIREKK